MGFIILIIVVIGIVKLIAYIIKPRCPRCGTTDIEKISINDEGRRKMLIVCNHCSSETCDICGNRYTRLGVNENNSNEYWCVCDECNKGYKLD